MPFFISINPEVPNSKHDKKSKKSLLSSLNFTLFSVLTFEHLKLFTELNNSKILFTSFSDVSKIAAKSLLFRSLSLSLTILLSYTEASN